MCRLLGPLASQAEIKRGGDLLPAFFLVGGALGGVGFGSLKSTLPVLPAVHDLPTGRRTFFNQLIAAFRGWKDARNDPAKAVCFGDGAPVDREAMQAVIQLSDELAFDVFWATGDVALIDNFLAMHGRRPFTGTQKILAAMI